MVWTMQGPLLCIQATILYLSLLSVLYGLFSGGDTGQDFILLCLLCPGARYVFDRHHPPDFP
jgi:hypothetical protein